MNRLKAFLAGFVDGFRRNKDAILNLVAGIGVILLYVTAVLLAITGIVAFVDIFINVTLFNSPFLAMVLSFLAALASFFTALAVVFFRGRAVMRARSARDPFASLRDLY